jgi:ubiquitin-conjugating enzyme (huntingtin interacting protein 2)
MVDVSRVQKELTECNRDREVSGVSIALHDGASISHLTGTIAGPKESPYEGGTFVIDIRLPSNPPPPPLPLRIPSPSPAPAWDLLFPCDP